MSESKLRVKGINTPRGGGNLTNFISVWNTGGDYTITLPLVPSGNYNFTVNWGDGNTDTITAWDQAEKTHYYGDDIFTTIIITGTIEGWSFAYNNNFSAEKLTSITNVGPLKLGNEGGYFAGCGYLTSIGGTFDLTGTTNFNGMFENCTQLTSVNGIGSWNTSAVTSMQNLFYGAEAFNQDISGWDVSSVTDMSDMFQGATSFNQPLNSWDVSNVESMSYMFGSAIAFNQDISGWNVSSVTNSMEGMFISAIAFNQDISGWNVSSVTNMNNMFADATAFNQDISGWDVSSVTDMSAMFAGASSFNQPLNSWDVSSVTNMAAMFGETKDNVSIFNQPLNLWDTSAVTDMSGMFSGNQYFNQDISGWNTAAVTFMISMFAGATAFNVDISGWNTSAVTDMSGMFYNAQSFNQDISGWDVSSVTLMSSMFADAVSFNVDISGWNTSAVTDMNSMFSSATSFNQDISGWNVSSVTDMSGMFNGSTSFNGDISGWDVSAVTNMLVMFQNATAFNQDISGWDVSNVTNMNYFMYGKSTADYDYYDDLLNAWSLLTLQNSVIWDMGSIEYTSAGATARQDIIDNYGWNITDGGEVVSLDFISVWDTTLGDANPSIQLPLVASGNYNFSVNWGDGNTDTITAYDQAEVTHAYATGGVYTITITGTIEGWLFNGGGDCQKLTSITNLGQLKLGNEGGYFQGCTNLTTVNGILDLTGTTNMGYMFDSCPSLTSVNSIGVWDISSVTNMENTFAGATAFNQPLNSWDTSAVNNMYGMFADATSFNQPLNLWNTSTVGDMQNMFYGATAFNQPLNSWDVSSVTIMGEMFRGATAFNQDISSWNISNVIYMDDFMAGKTTADYDYYDNLLNSWSLLTLQNGVNWGMGTIEYTAAGAAARVSIISNYSWTITDGGQGVGSFISVWNTSYGNGQPAITFPLLESGNYNFSVNWGDGNTDTITAWDQAEVTHTYATGGVKTITITGTIEGWSFGSSNVFGQSPKLTSITNIGPLKLGNDGFYFSGCSNLTTIGGTFDLTGTTNMNGIFGYCSSLTSVNGIGSWDTSAVTNMTGMFIGASSFNQNIGGWDTGVVTTMNSMLQDATAFDQDISGWDVSNVTSMTGFMDGKSTANYSYYDNLLNAWSLLTLQNGVTFGMGTIEYTTAGAAARASIISNYSWTITDGGEI